VNRVGAEVGGGLEVKVSSAFGQIFMRCRHVGLDFYGLLMEVPE
jgi:hypothetical protein